MASFQSRLASLDPTLEKSRVFSVELVLMRRCDCRCRAVRCRPDHGSLEKFVSCNDFDGFERSPLVVVVVDVAVVDVGGDDGLLSVVELAVFERQIVGMVLRIGKFVLHIVLLLLLLLQVGNFVVEAVLLLVAALLLADMSSFLQIVRCSGTVEDSNC